MAPSLCSWARQAQSLTNDTTFDLLNRTGGVRERISGTMNETRTDVTQDQTSVEVEPTAEADHGLLPRGSWGWVVTAGGAALALGVALLAALWFFQRPLAILFIALTIAAALEPLVGWLQQWLSRTLAVLVAFISLYTLIAAPNTHEMILSVVPKEREEKVNHVLGRIVHTMGGYVRAVSITGAIIGTLSYVGLLLIGVNFPLALAIVAGVSEFIPFIGPFVSGALMVSVAFLQSPTKALITLIFVIGLQQLEGNLIAPNVMHPQTCISPLTAVFALFAGASVGGVLGALIAVPLAAALRVLVVDVLLPALRRQTGAEPDQTVEC